MIESTIERKLVKEGKKVGLRFLKFRTPSRRHVPDRIIFLDGGITVFVECKRPGESLRPGQRNYVNQLIAKGFKVYTLDDINNVQEIIKEVKELSEESN